MDGYIGEIRGFAGNFPPQNWAYCQGQTLNINQYNALFALIGTIYGGNGSTNFMLPDLRGKAPVGAGQRPGFSNYNQGTSYGVETVLLTQNNLPLHNHQATATLTVAGTSSGNISPKCSPDEGDQIGAVGNAPAGRSNGYALSGDATGTMASFPASLPVTGSVGGSIAIANTGGSQQVSIIQPSLAINWIICLNGLWPSRD